MTNAILNSPKEISGVFCTPRGYRTAVLRQQFLRDLRMGLAAKKKAIPCKYFYDEEGSRLFERICELPEYYVTRTEASLLTRVAPEIAAACGEGVELMEFGSGAGKKIRTLLQALKAPQAYTPIDISPGILAASAARLRREFPQLSVRPCCADYTQETSWRFLPPAAENRRIVFFPGSTIGNFNPEEAGGFLRRLALAAGQRGALLVGVDQQKDPKVLERAYNDAAGVTAAFNMNLLHRIKRELRIDIPTEHFSHKAFYNQEQHRVEMHLVCKKAHEWRIGNRSFAFRRNETLHTENSYKYTPEGFRQLARASGLFPRALWTDEKNWFALHLLETAPFVHAVT